MNTTLDAIYENRKLVLSQPLALAENTHVQVTVEANDIVELLTPLIPELKQNICSPRGFYKKHVALLKKVRESKQPLVLWNVTGPVALVLDPRNYVELERRRQNITDLLSRIPGDSVVDQVWPTVGRRAFKGLKDTIGSIERLKRRIEHYKEQEDVIRIESLNPITQRRLEAEKALQDLEKQQVDQTRKMSSSFRQPD